MRVLLVLAHYRLGELAAAPRSTAALFERLTAAGHEVQVVDENFGDGFPARLIGTDRAAKTIAALSDLQLSDWRDAWRRRLDQAMQQFNPDIVHAQHVSLAGQLVLETGAPYVLTAWGPELSLAASDARVAQLAEQGVENASAVLVGSAHLQRQVSARFSAATVAIERVDWVWPLNASPAGPPFDNAARPGRPTLAAVFSAEDFASDDSPSIELLYNAASRCQLKWPDLCLRIAAPPEWQQAYAAHAERLGLQNLTWLPEESGTQHAFWSEASVAFAPIDSAGGNLHWHDAVSAGVWVAAVSDDTSGIGERPWGLVAPSDHELLADVIDRLLARSNVAENRHALSAPQQAALAAHVAIYQQTWARRTLG